MKILVLNCGSSSLKYKFFDMLTNAELARGQADRIGLPDAAFRHEYKHNKTFIDNKPVKNHHEAVHALLNFLLNKENDIITEIETINGVGHRVVHGGDSFHASVVVNQSARELLENTKILAPLHNPPNLMGIDICTSLMPSVPQVAVFDTAFHHSMPAYAYTYAIPYKYYEQDHVRKYGFHGISHQYAALRAAEILEEKLENLRIITCHLGAGSSLCAVCGGKSRDTSMGFTPLSGIVMSTRCGDIDPSIVSFIAEKEKISVSEVMNILNRQSGVLGISGVSPDFRDLEKETRMGNERAHLALMIYAYSAARGIASLVPAISGLDALVFTAGIGEHSSAMRERICEFLSWMDIVLDKKMNATLDIEGLISSNESKVKIIVIPTNEEIMIARETCALLKNNAH
ncbi:MAG TPA: acetate kinase [Smithellaceae bacterium]|nr:acetate kinase [Smithellaceae bacterium]HRS89932.1 acetate kinase [Smithellaceae bacterium]HRV26769.1 acetate kinase [Smithellaceae bacterium]